MIKFLMLVASLFHYIPARNLHENVHYWQRMLNLQSWQVSVERVRAMELDRETLGDIDVCLERKTARIRLLREQDYDLPLWRARADQMLTLAHEMVHLKRLVAARGERWDDERTTNDETLTLLRRLHRWPELMAVEKP